MQAVRVPGSAHSSSALLSLPLPQMGPGWLSPEVPVRHVRAPGTLTGCGCLSGAHCVLWSHQFCTWGSPLFPELIPGNPLPVEGARPQGDPHCVSGCAWGAAHPLPPHPPSFSLPPSSCHLQDQKGLMPGSAPLLPTGPGARSPHPPCWFLGRQRLQHCTLVGSVERCLLRGAWVFWS